MKYINKKTGGIIDTPFKVSGGDWLPFTETDLNPSDESGGTSTDALGITYKPTAKKADLYALMMKGA